METFEADDPSKLPKDAQILAARRKGREESDRSAARAARRSVCGPGDSFRPRGRRFLSRNFRTPHRRVIARRMKPRARPSPRASANRCCPIFCRWFSIPPAPIFRASPLNGTYLYDDEGVKARPVTVVDNGILKTFLMSRSPIDGFPQSNGHGRRSPGNEIVSRQSNLFVESSKKVSDAELRKMLIEEVKKQGKPYGLYFDQVSSGYTTTAAARIAGVHGGSAGGVSRVSRRPSGRVDSRRRHRRHAARQFREDRGDVRPHGSFQRNLRRRIGRRSGFGNRRRRFWFPKSRSSARNARRTGRRI